MQRLKASGAVRPIYGSLGVKRLIRHKNVTLLDFFTYHEPVQTLVFSFFNIHFNIILFTLKN